MRSVKWEWRDRVQSGEQDSDKGFSELIQSLQEKTGLSLLTLQTAVHRGFDTPEKIDRYLNPKLENLTSPFTIRDLEKAVLRILEMKHSEDANPRLRIYGDYDVDGTCGAALLKLVFSELGIRCDVRQPDRFKDGYGLGVKAVEEAHQEGIRLLVTVDCGITSFDAAAKARELGIELVIIDHHQIDPVKGLPIAHAVVNPQREDCESGLRQLCGCGLAFYVCMGLRNKARERGWVEAEKLHLKKHLDLVVIATAADMVPLVGDNRILVKHGMDVLKNSSKPGIRALLEVAGIRDRSLSPGHLGFTLGPRINASGRMSHASGALTLLSTSSAEEASRLALELEKLNRERMETQLKIWDSVKAKIIEEMGKGYHRNAIAVADQEWHEGVVGIVASRVVEHFGKPAIVCGIREGLVKGSVRSTRGINALEALRLSSEKLKGFGGHKYAAGLSLLPENWDAFRESFDRAIGSLPEDGPSLLWIDGECSLEDLQVKNLEELERLAPFGVGNPEPVFKIKATGRYLRLLKDRHLKLQLSEEQRAQEGQWTKSLAAMEAIWFHGVEKIDASMSEAIDSPRSQIAGEWVGTPEINRFNGRTTPTFRVRDYKSGV